MPDKWIGIEDRKVNLCGGCRANIPERSIFRCADCGLPFHQTCLDQHCKHGNQKQKLRSENLFVKSQLIAAIETLIHIVDNCEYTNDAEAATLREVIEWAAREVLFSLSGNVLRPDFVAELRHRASGEGRARIPGRKP